ncbi:MAG: ABC transporter substrate-binding protein [Methanobrevibacter sp.]|jgi:iron complex transport system substrate-binding protein|nr:ABC transporter substrate-binding protein [Methanobrevibacter sp.]
MKNENIIIIAIAVILIAGVAFFANDSLNHPTGNETVEDMVGRNVSIPSNPGKIVSTASPLTSLVYMIAPHKLAAVSASFKNDTKYVKSEYRELPAIGAWTGSKNNGNDEALLNLSPSFILTSPKVRNGSVVQSDLDLILNKFTTIPILAVPETANLTNLNKTYDFLGKVLHSEDSANKLKSTLNKYLDLGKKNTEATKANPKKVYYAQGEDGLTTSPPGSEHAQVLDIVGAKNVADVNLSAQTTKVNIEQLLLWNPEVIITTNKNFFKDVYKTPSWENIYAVKNKQVFLAPDDPFNWFDMPPGSNMIIGIPWALKVIYPDQNKDLNLKNEVKSFYTDFFHFDIIDDDIKNILNESAPNANLV